MIVVINANLHSGGSHFPGTEAGSTGHDSLAPYTEDGEALYDQHRGPAGSVLSPVCRDAESEKRERKAKKSRMYRVEKKQKYAALRRTLTEVEDDIEILETEKNMRQQKLVQMQQLARQRGEEPPSENEDLYPQQTQEVAYHSPYPGGFSFQ